MSAHTTPTILLWHGFMRSPSHLAPFVHLLMSAGFTVRAPHARGPIAMNSPATARRTARLLLDSDEAGTESIIIVTHSAGAALGAWSALAVHPRQVRGLVLADGTDNLVRGFARCLPRLRGVAINLVDADPSPCNRFGALSTQVRDTHHPVHQVHVVGAGHGDIERDVGAGRERGPSAVYARVCGDRSSDAVAAQFQAAVLAAVGSLAM